MRVEDCMRREIVTCSITDGLGYALRLMSLRRVRALVVVDPEGRAEGMLTRSDIALTRAGGVWRELRVWDVMGTPVHTCAPCDDALDARVRLQALEIERMPVVDAHGRVCGLVAREDLERALSGATDATRTLEEHAAVPPSPAPGRTRAQAAPDEGSPALILPGTARARPGGPLAQGH